MMVVRASFGRTICISVIAPLRACLISERVRIGEGIFRQSRREAEGILGVFQG